MILYRIEEVKKNNNVPMPFAMLLTRLYNHIIRTNPQAIVPLNRFMFYERVMNPLAFQGILSRKRERDEEHQNEKTPSPPPRKKSLSPPQAPSKSISSKSTHYTSSSSPSESPTPTHVAPPPKLRFVIPLKLKPQELAPLASSPNDPYVSTMDNWPLGPSKPSPPPGVTQPPSGFPHPPLI
ncbi:hypothetical protein Tco_0882623 [Tanacetum coccineum]